jgi:hypothetical protein
MIQVIFVIHALSKVSSGGGSLESLPEIGQMITMNSRDHKVLDVQTTRPKNGNPLRRPIIDVEPLPENPVEP